MKNIPRPWIVTRHDPIEKLDDNLWLVRGDLPGLSKSAGFSRAMHIIKLSDGRLAFHNAVPVDETALGEIVSWGKLSILIVPMHLHAMDAHGFRERLNLEVFTSKVVADKVRAIVAVDGTLEDLPKDPALRCEVLAGTKFGEAAYVVQSGARASIVFCDAIHNNRRGTGFNGFMFRLLGFAGDGPKVPPMYKVRALRDGKALKRDLLRLADTPGLVRLVPSHGSVVSRDPAAALRNAANTFL